MATSLSLPNFLSFLLPFKNHSPKTPPPPPPPQLSLSSPQIHSLAQKSKDKDDKLVPLVAQEGLSTELCSVICPSLAYSNALYFRSAYNVQVLVEENETEERLLNRFRREVMKAGVIQECKRRRYFENKQDEKKRKTREAAKRNKRRRPQSRFAPQRKPDTVATKREDEEDNWDLPEGDIPY